MKRTILASLLLLAGCKTGPTPDDVAADRDRWAAVRAVTADDLVDATEKPTFASLLAAWDSKLTADEKAVAGSNTTMQDLLRVYGVAAVQVFFGSDLEARAPELFKLIDKNSDHMLDESELLSIDPSNPVFAIVVVSTAARLLAKK